MRRRKFTAIAITLMVVVLVTSSVAIAATDDFGDVPPSHPFYNFINDFATLGITGGCGGGNYCPNDFTTRGQMAVFMVRLWKRVTTGSTTGALFLTPPWARTGSTTIESGTNGDYMRGRDSGGRVAFEVSPGLSGLYLGGGSGSDDGDLVLYGTSSKARYTTVDGDSGMTFYDGGSQYQFSYGSAVHYGDQRTAESDYTMRSRDDFMMTIDSDQSAGTGYFDLYNGAGSNIFWVSETGSMYASGTKSAVVDTASRGKVALYAVESTENWFEDFGSAQLANGSVTVEIDPVFAETVNLATEYHVLTTPTCDEPVLLFVSERTATSFTVGGQGLAGTLSNCSFSYRLAAKRLGYEEQRLAAVEKGGEVTAAAVEAVAPQHQLENPVVDTSIRVQDPNSAEDFRSIFPEGSILPDVPTAPDAPETVPDNLPERLFLPNMMR